MLFVRLFSPSFWVIYLCCGLSDWLDGFAARKLNQCSEAGARLDSAAALIFVAVMIVKLIANIKFPAWILACAAAVFTLRTVSYSVGYFKFHCFTALHTLLNKASGAILFLSPALYAAFGMTVSGVLVFGVTFLSSAEELSIILSSKTLERDRKGLFIK
ncbi:MAG: CDP-alcohol phosphatidyltransferase family protein [Eubacteriales bacterium]